MDHTKPAITLSSLDMDRIEALIEKLPGNFPGRAALEAELDRADVLDPADMPADVVTMNSSVRFTLQETGVTQTLTLVYPKEVDGSTDKVSVFAPVGTALLGLRVGDTLQLPSPTGKTVTVRVDAITYQPESAGEMHR
ncbi:MAG: nucleoside diphosphate kinase regulator [Comamonas sp.]